MTPIIATSRPNTDRRWFFAGDATVRPDALIVEGSKAPSTVSITATRLAFWLQARLDPLVTVMSMQIVRSGNTDQTHYPHRRPHHPA